MATSRLIPMHVNKGKTIAQCLADRIDYSKNADKTNTGQYVTSFGCNASIADAEFLYSKREYETLTGRTQQNDVIAYQIRQSFKPGEITPEEANQMAYELAMRFTKGNHAFIVCTHTDKKHIHSHVIFNSTALDCTRKFRNFWGSSKAVRRISDRICLEHGKSIIENPKFRSKGEFKHYGEWLENGKKTSYQERLRTAIDAALLEKPDDYNAFLALMEKSGWEYRPGKLPGFHTEGQKNSTRLRSLKDGYSENEIYAAITGETKHIPRKTYAPNKEPPRVNMLIDIQQKLLAGKGAGYERWAKVFNVKQMANTLNFLAENNLLEYADLAAKTAELVTRSDELSVTIKSAERRITEIAILKRHIINYSKTRDTYIAYRKAGYSKKFLAEHEGDIILHKAAKKAFDDLSLKKLPTVKALQGEYAELLVSKKQAYGDFVKVRDEKREALTAKANVDRLLGTDPARPEQEKDREQR